MKLLCNELKLHDWSKWRPGTIVTYEDDWGDITKTTTRFVRHCDRCGWLQTKEIKGSYHLEER